jgi:hypothetical protein
MNMENLEGGSEKEVGVRAKLEWVDAEAVPIVYANHLFVRHEEDNFVITLGQAHGPYWLEIPEELKGREIKVPIHAVARIAVPPQAMKSMLDALNQNYERFLRKQGRGEEK